MEENKPEIISNIELAIGQVGKPNDDSEIIVSLDFNKDSSISFDELKPYKISLNHTFNFKVKKQKSDFQKRIKNLQNSIK